MSGWSTRRLHALEPLAGLTPGLHRARGSHCRQQVSSSPLIGRNCPRGATTLTALFKSPLSPPRHSTCLPRAHSGQGVMWKQCRPARRLELLTAAAKTLPRVFVRPEQSNDISSSSTSSCSSFSSSCFPGLIYNGVHAAATRR